MNRRLTHASGFDWCRKKALAPTPATPLDAYTAGGRACQRGEPCVCRLRTRRRVQWIKGWMTAYADGAGD